MVSEKQHEGESLYLCDVCGFGYRKKEQAESCEEFCARTHSCSIAITKDAVYFPEPECPGPYSFSQSAISIRFVL